MTAPTPSRNPPLSVHGLGEIYEDYDVFLVDMIGVIHDGINPYPAAIDALQKLAAQHKKIIIISNNPRPGSLSQQKLVQYGLPADIGVFTSGDAVRHLLSTKWADKTFFHLGAHRNQDLLRDIPHREIQDISKADFVLLSAFLEPNETRGALENDLSAIVRHQKPVVCANPDLSALFGDQRRTCAGTLGAYLQSQGVDVTYIGKPYPSIFQGASEAYGISFPPTKTLMIGDTLETDILGGNQLGYDTLLVLTGITFLDMRADEQAAIQDSLMRQDASLWPTYYMPHLQF